MIVENRVLDATLTAMHIVVTLRVEMSVKGVFESAGRGLNSIVQNFKQRGFSGSMVNGPLLSTSRRLDTKIDQNGNDKTGNAETFKDATFRH